MKFKFRAECKHDVDLIKKALQESILHWEEFDVYLEANSGAKSVPFKVPDLDVEFETIENGPSLDEIRKSMSNIIDCHIPTQTVQLKENYTGVRNYRF